MWPSGPGPSISSLSNRRVGPRRLGSAPRSHGGWLRSPMKPRHKAARAAAEFSASSVVSPSPKDPRCIVRRIALHVLANQAPKPSTEAKPGEYCSKLPARRSRWHSRPPKRRHACRLLFDALPHLWTVQAKPACGRPRGFLCRSGALAGAPSARLESLHDPCAIDVRNAVHRTPPAIHLGSRLYREVRANPRRKRHSAMMGGQKRAHSGHAKET